MKVDQPGAVPGGHRRDGTTKSPELNVTGVVSADVSRNVPVISLASGRVVEIRRAPGRRRDQGPTSDASVQSADIAHAFSDYRQALADEQALAKRNWIASKALYDKGAIAQKDLEVAQRRRGRRPRSTWKPPSNIFACSGPIRTIRRGIVDVLAPVSGVITDQQVTAASGMQGSRHRPMRSPFPTCRTSGSLRRV